MRTEPRVALIIGNGDYGGYSLANALNDARAMARTLHDLGFEVTERENLSQMDMKREIQAFGRNLRKGGVGLFYYSGHGVQVGGRNFLIPTGASVASEKQVELEAVDVASVLAAMDHVGNRLNIVILDACRDNPFGESFRASVPGLASINAPSGTFIAYATAPGSVAGDGAGDNGVYTGALVRAVQVPGLRIEDVFKQVRSAVREATQGRQVPWESSSMEGDFYFKLPMGELPAGNGTPAVGGAKAGEGTAHELKTWNDPVTGIEFVWLPGGCFFMGSPQNERGREADEGPVHEVCLNGFWMSRTEVDNARYRMFEPGHNSGDYGGRSLNGDSQPAVFVTWNDAQRFARRLGERNEGRYKFRLPTEAEWEYAARGGAETSRYWGNDSAGACYYENTADLSAARLWGWDGVEQCDDGYVVTAPVGKFRPNGFGLFDMLGNVTEWCEDVYGAAAYPRHERNNPVFRDAGAGAGRVIRGGCWHSRPDRVRVAARSSGLPEGMSDDLGFRLVREP